MSKGSKYPLATVVPYGPNDKLATKLVVSIFTRPGSGEPQAMNKWFCDTGDVRDDSRVTAEVTEFKRKHRVKDTIVADRIFGCPHEEGIDYPEGGVCPECPLWANVDRFSGEAVPATVEEVLAALREEYTEPPWAALTGADRLRAELVEPLLELLSRCIDAPKPLADDDVALLSYAFYLLASWREPRAYPLIVKWLSLPGEESFEIGGDIVTQDGSRILASVCDGDLEPIKAMIENRACNEWARSAGIDVLAILVAWQEVPRQTVIEYLGFLAHGGLARVASEPWGALACTCVDLEADDLLPEIKRAFDEELIDPFLISEDEIDPERLEQPGERLAYFAGVHPPITDVAEAISWWSCFHKRRHRSTEPVSEPYIAPAKIGRNDQCPCGSGKKYKKCCGSAVN